MPSESEFAAAARTHLPGEMADKWLSLLRPALRLTHAEPAQTVVGHLGGLPQLPANQPWPHWQRHGPLTYIAGLDCAALPSQAAEMGMPPDGQLLFFYFDGQYDDCKSLVLPSEPDSQAGAQVLYIEAWQVVAPSTTPDGIEAYPRVPLAAKLIDTTPSYDHPVLHDTFGTEFTHSTQHPVRDGDFASKTWWGSKGPLHQLGGYAWPVQGDVEYEIATRDASQPREWTLLAQFDSDDKAHMMWGDSGMLYWLIKPVDLASRLFDRTAFTWQCC